MRRKPPAVGPQATAPPPPPATPTPAATPSPSHPIRPPRAERPPARARCAEVAGGTAASCAAVCCCCPCALVDLIVLTIVKVPAGLCRKAMRKRRLAKRGGSGPNGRRALLAVSECDDASLASAGGPKRAEEVAAQAGHGAAAVPKEMEEMEEEMWAKFSGTGFWRSPSQRDQ